MTDKEAAQKRGLAAHSPEARAKRAATIARKKAERDALVDTPQERKALKKLLRPVQSIPLDMIPDEPKKVVKRKSYYAKGHPAVMTKEWAAMEIMRLTMWLAGQK